jgi:hypothetical protein
MSYLVSCECWSRTNGLIDEGEGGVFGDGAREGGRGHSRKKLLINLGRDAVLYPKNNGKH